MIKIRFMKKFPSIAQYLLKLNLQEEEEFNKKVLSDDKVIVDMIYEMIKSLGYMTVDYSNAIDTNVLNILINKAKNCRNRDLLIYLEILFKLSQSNNIANVLLSRLEDMRQIVYNYDYAINDMEEYDHYSLYFINELMSRLGIEKREPSLDLYVYVDFILLIKDIDEIIKNKYSAHILDDENDLITRYSINMFGNFRNEALQSLYDIVVSMMMNDNKPEYYKKNNDDDESLRRETMYYKIYDDCIKLLNKIEWPDE